MLSLSARCVALHRDQGVCVSLSFIPDPSALGHTGTGPCRPPGFLGCGQKRGKLEAGRREKQTQAPVSALSAESLALAQSPLGIASVAIVVFGATMAQASSGGPQSLSFISTVSPFFVPTSPKMLVVSHCG